MFNRLIIDNGVLIVEDDEKKGYYFEKFDIIPYSEVIFKTASSPDTREMNRDILYDIYERASGRYQKEEEVIPYAQKFSPKPKTKRAKRIQQWKKVKTV